MKCWLSEWLDFLFPEPVEVDMGGEPDIPAKSYTAESYTGKVHIPEFYRRHIPVLEPDTMTPKSADAYVRSRR